MCTNIHKVYNKYLNREMYVDCRNCIPCRQQIADSRAMRIRYHSLQDDIQPLFFHLTYSNEFVPYFRYSDLKDCKKFGIFSLPVYRDSYCSWSYKTKNKKYQYLLKKSGTHVINEINLSDFLSQLKLEDKLHSITNMSDYDKISVIHNKDIQLFFKRLRKNLSKNVKLPKDELCFTYFQCSEYGETNQRCHFHVLLFVKNAVKNLKFWKREISKAWPFALRNITTRNIEIARDAAAYVSSYLCKSINLPSLFQYRGFKPSWSHSKNFAVDSKLFTVSFIHDCIEKESFRFNFQFNSKGLQNNVSMLVPSYIIRHYFPRFRGFSYLSSAELQQLYEVPEDFSYFESLANKMRLFKKDSCELDYKLVDRCYMFFVNKVHDVIEKFHDAPFVLFDKVRRIERKHIFELMYDEQYQRGNYPVYERYYNLLDLKKNPRLSPSLLSFLPSDSDKLDPNNFKSVLDFNLNKEDKYFRRYKYKKFSNGLITTFSNPLF